MIKDFIQEGIAKRFHKSIIAKKYINERFLNNDLDICEVLYLKELNTKIKKINNNLEKINVKRDINYLIDNPIKYLGKMEAVNCPNCKKSNNKILNSVNGKF